jgi:hypothetical protein
MVPGSEFSVVREEYRPIRPNTPRKTLPPQFTVAKRLKRAKAAFRDRIVIVCANIVHIYSEQAAMAGHDSMQKGPSELG